MIRRLLLIVVAIALGAGSVSAQVLDSPTDKLRIDWPAPNVAADGLDAPSGIRVTAVNPTQTGVVVRTWDVGPNETSLELSTQQLPAGMFSVTVAPFNNFGVAGGTAPVGPFGKMTTPKSLGTATGSVVEGGSASLARPASGAAPSIWIPTSTPSITRIFLDDSVLSLDSATGEYEWSKSSLPPEMRSAYAWRMSSPPAKPSR